MFATAAWAVAAWGLTVAWGLATTWTMLMNGIMEAGNMDISRIGNTTIGSRIGNMMGGSNTTIGSRIGNIMIHDGKRMGNRSGNRIGNRIGMMVMVMEDGISLVTGMMVMVMMMVMAIMEDGITGSQNDNWHGHRDRVWRITLLYQMGPRMVNRWL